MWCAARSRRILATSRPAVTALRAAQDCRVRAREAQVALSDLFIVAAVCVHACASRSREHERARRLQMPFMSNCKYARHTWPQLRAFLPMRVYFPRTGKYLCAGEIGTLLRANATIADQFYSSIKNNAHVNVTFRASAHTIVIWKTITK